MLDQILKIEISASTVAWYGAIVATTSIAIAILNYLCDRPRIKIKYMKDVQIMGQQPIYDSSKTYFNITVINQGRRPIKIDKAALKILNKKGFWLLSDSFAAHRVKVLTEENPRTEFLADQAGLDISKILYITVYDATGREYRKYLRIFPTFRRVSRWLSQRK